MNKTVNVNIGGLFFHIDEDAYQKLSRYFDAIKRSLTNSSGKDEIMKDIEMRVAEIFSERQQTDKHVINLKDVDEVVAVMGQPEDYRIDEDGETTQTNFTSTSRKKLYRDKDKGIVGGVCTGLGHYFGVDSIWIKIIFLIFVFVGFGTGVLAYFILWVIIPEAKTTAEKLEMTGEPVNISNIEKKVREEFENVSQKIKNVDYDKVGNQIKSGAENAGSRVGDVLTSVFSALAKVIGAFIVFTSAMILLSICVGSIILMFSASLPQNTIMNNIMTPLGFETPLWIQGILFLFAAGIPTFFILYLGLKLLSSSIKSMNSILKYGLLGVWVIAVGILVSLGIKEAGQMAFDGKSVTKELISINPTDTLFVKFKNNDFYTKNVNERRDFRLTLDESNKQVIYSNNVSLRILTTDEAKPYIQIEKLAYGKNPSDSKKRAESIRYGYKIDGNHVTLDNYILTDFGSKFRNQSVEIFLYLPKGTIFKPDSSLENYDNSDDNVFNLHYSGEYTYKADQSKIRCLDCPAYEDEYNDLEIDSTSVDETEIDSTGTIQFNKDGILIKKTKTTSDDKEVKEVKINKDGISIKTN